MLLMSFSVFNGFELFELNDEPTSKASYTLSCNQEASRCFLYFI